MPVATPDVATSPRLPAARVPLLVGLILLPTSLVQVGVGAYHATRTLSLVQGGETAPGLVVAQRMSSKGGAKPVVEFTPKGGSALRIEGSASSKPPAYFVGERVIVHYRPDDPPGAQIDGFLEMWFLPTLLGGLGGAELLVGGVFAFIGLARRFARSRVREQGWRIPAVVVDSKQFRRKSQTSYEAIVEAPHPTTGATTRYVGDRQGSAPAHGASAIVYVDQQAPNAYFVGLD